MSNIVRLSQIEAMIAKMREHADRVGNDDPVVEFFTPDVDHNLVIAEMKDVTAYAAKWSGDQAKKGDFCLYLAKAE